MQHSNTSSQSSAPAQQPGLFPLLARDLATALASISIWAAADTWYLISGIGLALAVSMANAIFAGYVLGALFHEWGHYLGARVSRAQTTRIQPTGFSFFRFNFDFKANDQRQFHSMSFGGWIMHWALLLLLVLALPFDSLGQVTLVSAVLGFILFATVIETGILRQTLTGTDPLKMLKKLTPRHFQQAAFVGTLCGVLLLAVMS